jgi:hypothetical protein
MQFRFIFDGIPNTFFGKIMKKTSKTKTIDFREKRHR